jgi:hypothetical protein
MITRMAISAMRTFTHMRGIPGRAVTGIITTFRGASIARSPSASG